LKLVDEASSLAGLFTEDVPVPNKVHQADLLYLPHDRPPRSRKIFKYALTVVDVAS